MTSPRDLFGHQPYPSVWALVFLLLVSFVIPVLLVIVVPPLIRPAGHRPVEEESSVWFGVIPPQWADPAESVISVNDGSRRPSARRVTAVLARDGKPIVVVRDVYPLARGPKRTLLVRHLDDELRHHLGLVTWDEATPSTRWVARMREHEIVNRAAISPDGKHVVVGITLSTKPPRFYCRTGVFRGGQLQLSEPVPTDEPAIEPIWWRDSRHVLFEVPSLTKRTGFTRISTIRVLDTQTSRSWPLLQLRSFSLTWTVPASRDGLLLTGQEPSGLHLILKVRDDLRGLDALYTWQEEMLNAQVSPAGDTRAIYREASDSAGRDIKQTVLRDVRSGTEVVLEDLAFWQWRGETFLASGPGADSVGCYSADGELLWSWSPLEKAGPSTRPEG